MCLFKVLLVKLYFLSDVPNIHFQEHMLIISLSFR